jgi:hypothetical protein
MDLGFTRNECGMVDKRGKDNKTGMKEESKFHFSVERGNMIPVRGYLKIHIFS